MMLWMRNIMLHSAIKRTKFTYKSYYEMVGRLFKWVVKGI